MRARPSLRIPSLSWLTAAALQLSACDEPEPAAAGRGAPAGKAAAKAEGKTDGKAGAPTKTPTPTPTLTPTAPRQSA